LLENTPPTTCTRTLEMLERMPPLPAWAVLMPLPLWLPAPTRTR
jgi:hypothetical protein